MYGVVAFYASFVHVSSIKWQTYIDKYANVISLKCISGQKKPLKPCLCTAYCIFLNFPIILH